MSLWAAAMLLPLSIQGSAVGERFPAYPLPPVQGAEQRFEPAAFLGKPALSHVFASW